MTPEERAVFLETLADTASVTVACKSIGYSRNQLYLLRKEDTEFAKAWEEALTLGTAALEDEAVRRAHQGVDEPVFYKGDIVGKVRKYSDTLLIFLLKAHSPEKYREHSKVELTGKDGGPIETLTTKQTPEERAARIAELLAKRSGGSGTTGAS